MNGILKQKYGLGCSFKSGKQALAAAGEAVFPYNTRRPHLALNYETPENTHPGVAQISVNLFQDWTATSTELTDLPGSDPIPT
ncbi:MAG: transposase [Spirochaetaceae bacterium]|nr:transposase [Spirochaetaceae bacterium]